MTPAVRFVIVALLSLLLPLQTSLAYARAVGMMTVRAATATPERPALAQSPVATTEQGSHADHHHPRNQHADQGAKKPGHFVKAAGHPASHSPSGNACDTCAKCCLTGAAAPPLIWPQAAGIAATRALFIATSDTPSCFIADAPERPPRFL